MTKTKPLFAIVILLVVGGVFLFYNNSKISKNPSPTILPSPAQQFIIPSPSPEETVKPILSEKTPTTNKTTSPTSNGDARGKISCNYQIPAAPSKPGTASIEVSWNDLILGNAGTAKVAVCLFVSSSNQVMFTDTKSSGTTTISAPWIAMNTDYTFTLYDNHGGDLPECAGVVLSSCRLDTNSSSGPKPTSTPR